MANVDLAFGFRAVGSHKNPEIQECVALSSYATALFVGDTVIPGGSGDISGRPSVTQGAAGSENTLGVIVGFANGGPDDMTTHRGEASTTRYPLVLLAHSNVEFEVNPNTAIGPSDIGSRFDIVVASGSTVTGRSGMELDVSTTATTGKTLRLMRFRNSPDNAISAVGSSQVGTICIVTFAESTFTDKAGV